MRRSNDSLRCGLSTCFGGLPSRTYPGVVFCNAKGGGEFIVGTCGTVIAGGGGGAGGGGKTALPPGVV